MSESIEEPNALKAGSASLLFTNPNEKVNISDGLSNSHCKEFEEKETDEDDSIIEGAANLLCEICDEEEVADENKTVSDEEEQESVVDRVLNSTSETCDEKTDVMGECSDEDDHVVDEKETAESSEICKEERITDGNETVSVEDVGCEETVTSLNYSSDVQDDMASCDDKTSLHHLPSEHDVTDVCKNDVKSVLTENVSEKEENSDSKSPMETDVNDQSIESDRDCEELESEIKEVNKKSDTILALLENITESILNSEREREEKAKMRSLQTHLLSLSSHAVRSDHVMDLTSISNSSINLTSDKTRVENNVQQKSEGNKIQGCDGDNDNNNNNSSVHSNKDLAQLSDKEIEAKHLLLSTLNIIPKSKLLTNESKDKTLDLSSGAHKSTMLSLNSGIGNNTPKRKEISSPPFSGPLSKRRKITSVSPKCNTPFLKGWKRELVYRTTCDSSKNRAADVYYYSPANEKLRSYREVEEFLKRTHEKDLTIDCFSFTKIAIHKSPQEIVRYARPRSGTPGSETIKNKSTTKPSPGLKKTIVEGHGNTQTESKADGTTVSTLSGSFETPKLDKVTYSKRGRPYISRIITKKKRGKTLFVRAKKTFSKVKTKEVEEKPCSLSCPGHIGELPSLHCGVCLCLFHPSCVGLTDNSKPFMCTRCILGTKKKITENGRKRRSDVVNISSSPVSIEVNPEFPPEDYDDHVEPPPTSTGILPSLLAAPPKLVRNPVCEKPRPPPPLKKAPTLTSIQIPIRTTATWTPPSGLPLFRHPPPLQLASTLKNFPDKNIVIFRQPPPLLKRPPVPTPKDMTHPVFSHVNTLISQSQNFVSKAPLAVPKTVFSQAQSSHNGQVKSLPLNITNVVGSKNLPIVSKVTFGNLTNLTSSKTSDSTAPNPAVNVIKTYSRTNNLPNNNLASRIEQQLQTILKPTVMAQYAPPPPLLTNPTPGTMKFVLKTNSGTTTEVLVPQQNFGPCAPKPRYIVVNKQGQPTGLVLRIGDEDRQVPVLNTKSNNHPETLLKDAVPPPKPIQPAPVTITLDDDAIKMETVSAADSAPHLEQAPRIQHPLFVKKPVTTPPVSRNESPAASEPCKNAAKMCKRQQNHPNPGRCSIQWLHGGINSLMKIFEYLHQDDLSRIASVCRTWHWLVSQPALWKTIKLDGILVYDWESLINIMKKYRSYRLDMRTMLTFEDRNRTWHGFAAILQDLNMVKFIHFGYIPISILHTVVNTLTQLEELTAEWIMDISRDNSIPISKCRLDFRKFGRLHNLRKLLLRGVHGIQFYSIEGSYSLSDLDTLTKLTYLSLTTLKDVPVTEFEFLKSLVNLETLELGECMEWTDQTYENLHGLTNLKMLRLEYGGKSPNDGLVNALICLEDLNHLELYSFKLDERLLNYIAARQNLIALSLWPQESQKGDLVNALILKAVQKLSLKVFVWGVITEKHVQTASLNQSADDDVIEIVSDDEEEGKTNESAVERIPLLLLDSTPEDGAKYPTEYPSLTELNSLLSKMLPNTKRIIHMLSVENSSELSRIKI